MVARWIFLSVTIILALNAAETDSAKLWTDLKAKREKLGRVHQEFEVTRETKTSTNSRSSKTQIVLDMVQGKWREKSVSGSGSRLRIFDGKDLFSMEEGGDEYVRVKLRGKDSIPAPPPYPDAEADWSKARELQRVPCGFSGKDDTCLVLDVPINPGYRPKSAGSVLLVNGMARITIDTENGVILSVQLVEAMQNQRTSYQTNLIYRATRLNYGAPADAALFMLPEGVREVKELPRWNAAKIKEQLVGKAAPELNVVDIHGNPVTLSGLKGKTVLLDFWTTWCPPCRADAPSLDRLYRKYGGQELAIVGISVSEERPIVEKFLKDHPHDFPIALTTENDLPPAYQIGVFPTYIVIDRDGKLRSAVDGGRGFSDLRKLLKNAGLEVD